MTSSAKKRYKQKTVENEMGDSTWQNKAKIKNNEIVVEASSFNY